MTERIPPHDLDAEENLLGAMLMTPHALTVGVETVVPEDFYKPVHATVFGSLAGLWRSGDRVDGTAVMDDLRRQGLADSAIPPLIQAWVSGVPVSSNVDKYAAIVVEHAARRRVIRVATNAVDAAYLYADPSALIDETTAELSSIDLPTSRVPDDLWTLDDFRTQKVDPAPWVVPDLMRRGWRVVVVADEGAGKSLIAQQIAMCAAAGLHPFTLVPIEPVCTLLVDLENDAHRIIAGTALVDDQLLVRRRGNGGVWLWHRPGGINLRQRKDRTTFEAVLAHCRPQLVCLGPIYKAYDAKASESYELVAREVQQVLDDLRTRYKFGLLLEHHAPQGESKNVRDMRPYGSSLWLRWPEFGVALKRSDDNKSLIVDRWRGDRVKGNWPQRLDRGKAGEFPWVGWWESTEKKGAA